MQHLSLERDNKKIFFTSDTHFGHRNIIERFVFRPFKDAKEMGEALIANWNSVVSDNDIVFHLGDFVWWEGRHEAKKLINKLNGTIYLIPGNHDKKRNFELCDPEKLIICDDVTVLHTDYNKLNIVMCHYPLMCYSQSEKDNFYQFFGHIHSLPHTKMTEFGRPLPIIRGRYLDVGCDRHNYTPQELDDLVRECKSYK